MFHSSALDVEDQILYVTVSQAQNSVSILPIDLKTGKTAAVIAEMGQDMIAGLHWNPSTSQLIGVAGGSGPTDPLCLRKIDTGTSLFLTFHMRSHLTLE